MLRIEEKNGCIALVDQINLFVDAFFTRFFRAILKYLLHVSSKRNRTHILPVRLGMLAWPSLDLNRQLAYHFVDIQLIDSLRNGASGDMSNRTRSSLLLPTLISKDKKMGISDTFIADYRMINYLKCNDHGFWEIYQPDTAKLNISSGKNSINHLLFRNHYYALPAARQTTSAINIMSRFGENIIDSSSGFLINKALGFIDTITMKAFPPSLNREKNRHIMFDTNLGTKKFCFRVAELDPSAYALIRANLAQYYLQSLDYEEIYNNELYRGMTMNFQSRYIRLLALTSLSLFISFLGWIFLMPKIGFIGISTFLTLGFFLLYSIWENTGLAIMRPRFVVAATSGSFLMLIASLLTLVF
jgi:hypothetical protein